MPLGGIHDYRSFTRKEKKLRLWVGGLDIVFALENNISIAATSIYSRCQVNNIFFVQGVRAWGKVVTKLFRSVKIIGNAGWPLMRRASKLRANNGTCPLLEVK